jgi:spermidine synthase
MAWKELHELTTRNGRMRLVKFFGTERLLAEDRVEQSGPYMNGLWKKALKTLPSPFTPKRIAFLGVGTGGALRIFAQRYPHAHITGIEWDSTLCKLAQERLQKEQNISIQEIAAEDWAKTMNYYDILCVDLFTGAHVAPCVQDVHFLRYLITHAQVTFVNIYTHIDILDHVDKGIAELPRKRLQYYLSTIGMYGSSDVRG